MNRMGARRLVAFAAWHVCLAVSALGCLVTEQPNWDEENVPANVSVDKPATFSRVGAIPDTTCSSNDTGGPQRPPDLGSDQRMNQPWVNFVVQVHDSNVEDRLYRRVLINGERNGSKSGEIPITGRKDRDPVSFCLDWGELNRACNRVELLVSRRFSESDSWYETEDPDDLAKVEWWILGPAEQYPEVSADACEQVLREP